MSNLMGWCTPCSHPVLRCSAHATQRLDPLAADPTTNWNRWRMARDSGRPSRPTYNLHGVSTEGAE